MKCTQLGDANDLKTAAQLAQRKAAAGESVKLNFDTVKNGVVIGRIQFDLSKPISGAGDIKLGVSNSNAYVQKVFEKFYENKTAIVDLEHKGSFGAEVEIAVKTDLDGLDTQNLVFLSYDINTNKYTQIQAKYYIDKNGYLHFITDVGGSIIITDGKLIKK